jgi:hypothetical protein
LALKRPFLLFPEAMSDPKRHDPVPSRPPAAGGIAARAMAARQGQNGPPD